MDTRKLIKVPVPELLDLQTIHLDYIAQEKDMEKSRLRTRTKR